MVSTLERENPNEDIYLSSEDEDENTGNPATNYVAPIAVNGPQNDVALTKANELQKEEDCLSSMSKVNVEGPDMNYVAPMTNDLVKSVVKPR